MSDAFPSRRISAVPRVRIALRLTAVLPLVIGPIGLARWEIHQADRFPPVFMEVTPTRPAGGPPAGSTRATDAAARVAEYLERRNPAVEHFLPEGTGGTRFFEQLDGAAGRAFPAAGAIGLALTAIDGGWPEGVEVHERAHLAEASLPRHVVRVLARLPSPSPDEYAAMNPGEHFAEMAAAAWQLVVSPDGAASRARRSNGFAPRKRACLELPGSWRTSSSDFPPRRPIEEWQHSTVLPSTRKLGA